MRVLWLHNFPIREKKGGMFVRASLEAMERSECYIDEKELSKLFNVFCFVRGAYDSWRLINQGRYEIIHAQFGSACGLLCSMLPGRKLLYLRGSDWYRLGLSDAGGLRFAIHSALQSALTRICLRRFSAVTCVSNRLACDVKARFPGARVYTLPSPIDVRLFRPGEKALARRELGLDQTRRYVVFSSLKENNPIKRPSLAARAVALAREQLPDVQVLAASGIEHERMPLVYQAADLTLMTSSYEGWPNSVKESLACGTPVVCTDVSDVLEALHGLPHCEVSNDDVASIADAIVRSLSAHRTKADTHAIAERGLRFGYERFSQDLLRVYDTEVLKDVRSQAGGTKS